MDDLVLTDGSENIEEDILSNPYLQDTEAWGAVDGTTILPVTPTPSADIPDNMDNSKDSEEVIALTEEIKKLNENIESLFINEPEGEDNTEDSAQDAEQANQETDEEVEEVTIDTINDDLLRIESILESISEQQIIASQNESLFSEFILGFLVAFFFGFVIHLFFSRIR